VASANAKNPLWIVVPCHKVLGQMVRLLVTQADYGAKWLLEHEAIIATKFILAATPILELHILSFFAYI
jgi:hypothetical protein